MSELYCEQGYDTESRFESYHHQARLVLGLKPKKVLEIGIGNYFFTDYLRRRGVTVKTGDYLKRLKPDYWVDLSKDFKLPKNEFDVITLFQILEHIPFEKSILALKKLKESTKKYVVISIPYQTTYFSLHTKIPLTGKPVKALFQIERSWNTTYWSREHFWEMGTKGYSKKKVLGEIEGAGYTIVDQYQDALNPYHYFLVLEKKTN